MGLGDELMALGEAQRLSAALGGPVTIVGVNSEPRWHPVWDGQAAVLQPGNELAGGVRVQLVNGPNARSYIRRWDTWEGKPKAVFSDWRARDFHPTYALGKEFVPLGLPQNFVVVEHRVSGSSSPNKAYPAARMREVIAGLEGMGLQPLFVSPTKEQPGALVPQIYCASIGELMQVMARAVGYIGIEGGLHHAAAALNRPAVVIFGGCVSPEQTGYFGHCNLTGGNKTACGRWAPCPHCEKAMAAITPAIVLEAARSIFLNKQRQGVVWDR